MSDKRIAHIEAMLESLVADRSFDTRVPLPLSNVAKICCVNLRTLRGWVDRKEIEAHRTCEGAPWRVFPKDVTAFLMSESSKVPARRLRVLRRA